MYHSLHGSNACETKIFSADRNDALALFGKLKKIQILPHKTDTNCQTTTVTTAILVSENCLVYARHRENAGTFHCVLASRLTTSIV